MLNKIYLLSFDGIIYSFMCNEIGMVFFWDICEYIDILY